jgi:hypothetical protein
MRGTRIEKEIEIYATNLAKKYQAHEHQCIEKMEKFAKILIKVSSFKGTQQSRCLSPLITSGRKHIQFPKGSVF